MSTAVYTNLLGAEGVLTLGGLPGVRIPLVGNE